jgi:hypothetical protein
VNATKDINAWGTNTSMYGQREDALRKTFGNNNENELGNKRKNMVKNQEIEALNHWIR